MARFDDDNSPRNPRLCLPLMSLSKSGSYHVLNPKIVLDYGDNIGIGTKPLCSHARNNAVPRHCWDQVTKTCRCWVHRLDELQKPFAAAEIHIVQGHPRCQLPLAHGYSHFFKRVSRASLWSSSRQRTAYSPSCRHLPCTKHECNETVSGIRCMWSKGERSTQMSIIFS